MNNEIEQLKQRINFLEEQNDKLTAAVKRTLYFYDSNDCENERNSEYYMNRLLFELNQAKLEYVPTEGDEE